MTLIAQKHLVRRSATLINVIIIIILFFLFFFSHSKKMPLNNKYISPSSTEVSNSLTHTNLSHVGIQAMLLGQSINLQCVLSVPNFIAFRKCRDARQREKVFVSPGERNGNFRGSKLNGKSGNVENFMDFHISKLTKLSVHYCYDLYA